MQKADLTLASDNDAARPRGRPRAFDRTAALEQATRLFWQKGYEATSIADLTRVMRIGSPSLYAAFGSKEALYAEALRNYGATNEHLIWSAFRSARTARAAVLAFLENSAAALTGSVSDVPRGCMVTLSSVGSEGHAELGALVREARATTFDRLEARLRRGVEEGEIAPSADLHALARFVQTVQAGMSILARDGASGAELKAVSAIAMSAWYERTKSIG